MIYNRSMIKTIHLFQWCSLLSGALLLCACGPSRADGSTPDSTRIALKKNYLSSILAVSKGTEKQFLEALQKSDDKALMENLGLLREVKAAELTPFYSSQNEKMAELQAKRLGWQATIGEADKARQVLVFDRQLHMWPGYQPITIILVDSNFKVLSWLESGGSPMFSKASLQTAKASTVLETRSANRTGGVLVEHFKIRETITKLDSHVEPSPPDHNIAKNWVRVGAGAKF
jgi:hypothetical protein